MCFFEQERGASGHHPGGRGRREGARSRVGPGGSAQHAVCMGQRISQLPEADGLKRKKADGLG